MKTTALIVTCVGSVIGCLGASYLANKISEAPQIHDRDILQTTSIEGVSTLSKDAAKTLIQDPKDPKEIFQLYLAKTLTLEDALELLTQNGNDSDIKSIYKDVTSRIQTMPEDSDTRAYLEAFQKALEKYYSQLKPAPPVAESPPAPEPVAESPAPEPVAEPPPPPPTPEPEPVVEPPPAPTVATPTVATPTVSEPPKPPADTTAPNPLTESDQTEMSTPIAPPKVGGRRRNVTQKQRHPVIRTILYA